MGFLKSFSRVGLIILFAAPAVAVAQGGVTGAGDRAASLQAAFIEVAREVGPSVVGVYNIQRARIRGYVLTPRGYLDMDQFFKFLDEPIEQRSLGSGLIIGSDGYILTNEHVVGRADAIEVTLSDGRRFEGKVIGKDARSDVALIKVDATALPTARLGDSDDVRTGQWAIAIGNPFGIFEDNPMPAVTVGVVSAIHKRLPGACVGGRYYGDLIQTDAAINPGNSGGPLLNLKGEVIGINAAIISPSRAYAGIGLAIPINRAKEVLEALKKGEEIEYGWLGVGIQPVTKEIASELNVPDLSGALVVTVIPGSPAAVAGIRPGDLIRGCGERIVRDPDSLTEEVSRNRAGSTIRLKVLREGKEREIDVVVGRKGEKVA